MQGDLTQLLHALLTMITRRKLEGMTLPRSAL